MKALFIGGTGTISSSVSTRCLKQGWDLTLLTRGVHNALAPEGAKLLKADIADEAAVRELIKEERYDVVADFIAFTPDQVERDIRLFSSCTSQYIFISSASAYQKPLAEPLITEATPLYNPYWQYSRDKIACEEVLMRARRESGFPVTIIRPSHTYCERSMPVGLHGAGGSFAVLERIRMGRKIIIPGDGLTLWTLTHSRDFAKGFCGLMGNIHAIGESYQIMGDECLTWNQIHQCIANALGVRLNAVHIASETLAALHPAWEGPLLGDKSNNLIFDTTKLKRAVPDFHASTRFDQGAREIVSYIYSHPECQKLDSDFDAWCDQVIERYEALTAQLPAFQ
ncbi:MAG: SDR family oxidoreductase [Eubacteriales bacterium]|nr:SDR family oxidoreductase [Eubacteriales bacterium]